MAVEDLTHCDIRNKKITADEPKQQLLNDNKPIISSKRLTHSGHNRQESSFRIYYGANNGDISVPFNWESHPGTPKQNISTTSCSDYNRRGKSNHSSPSRTNKNTSFNPPLSLTPPPSYQVKKLQAAHASCKHPTDITGSTSSPRLGSKININHLLSTALPRRFVLLKNSSSNASGTNSNSSSPTVVDPHSRSSSSSSPRTSLSSLWAASGSSESSSGTHSPRTTPVDVVQGRKSRRRTWGGDMDQLPGAGKQVVNRRSFSTVDSDDDEDTQCSSTCFGTPSTSAAYTSDGYRGGGGHTTSVKKAILSVVSCRVMRSSHHHVDYVV